MMIGERIGWVVRAAAWVVTMLLLGICLLHLLQILDTTWEIAAVGVSPLVLAVGLPIGVGAIIRRRWALATASAIVAVAWAAWAGPDFWPVAHASAPAGPSVRLFDANVSQSNRNLDGIGSEIRRDRAQVVILEELTPVALRSLRSTGVLSAYRWSIVRPAVGPGGMGLWSSVAATGMRSWTVGDGQVELEGWIHPTGEPAIRVDGVHVYAPAFGPDQPAEWHQQLGAVYAHLAAEPRPLLVAGDFNATWDLQPFRRILGLGLSDAAVLEGRGWEMTWPRDQAPVIPYLRLDHVLISDQLTVTSYGLGDGAGSDHHPLLASIAPARQDGDHMRSGTTLKDRPGPADIAEVRRSGR